MKNIAPKLIELFKEGYCTPQIARLAKKIKEPSTTIHYNIKKLEKDGIIKTYKAVFDYQKVDLGHCTYLLVDLNSEKYADPEEIARQIAKHSQVESVDIVAGDHGLILKVRNKNIDDYYHFLKFAMKKYGFAKVVSLTTLKQIKTEFVEF